MACRRSRADAVGWTVDGGKGFVPAEVKSQRCDRQVVQSPGGEKRQGATVAKRHRIVVLDGRD